MGAYKGEVTYVGRAISEVRRLLLSSKESGGQLLLGQNKMAWVSVKMKEESELFSF